MISTHILCLTLPNVFCFGYRLGGVKSDTNNFHLSNEEHIEETNAVPIEKKMLDSSFIASSVKTQPNCHGQHASPSSLPSHCQHVHLHFNGTRGEMRAKWQMPCLSIFLMIIIIVLILNCFHYNYELGMNYECIEDELSSEDEIVMNRKRCRTKCLLGAEATRTLVKSGE